MAFVSAGTVDTLPKRIGAGRKFNQAGANALLAIVNAVPGATASDGQLFTDAVKARGAAGAAKRLLEHVTDPETIKSRTYADDDGFRWVVYLKPVAVTETPVAEPVNETPEAESVNETPAESTEKAKK